MKKWIPALLVSIPFAGYTQSDDPCAAQNLAVDSVCVYQTGTNAGATNTAGAGTPPCGSYGGSDVWYSLIVPADGIINIETTTGTLTDVVMAAYSGSCTSLSVIACDDDSGPGLMPKIDLSGLTAGDTVWLRLWEYGGDLSGTFNICVYYPSGGAENYDCVSATQICMTDEFDDNSSGDGVVNDLNASNRGCLSTNEHQSAWYYFQISTSGTLTFTIDPDVNGDDFDFAVWGPASSCPPTAPPTRCSYSALNGNTGLNTSAMDLSEDAGGNKWVRYMDVLAAEVYILCVDNFSASNSGFLFSFGGTATISCEPFILPVTLVDFNAEIAGNTIQLTWSTSAEMNSLHFVIERSSDNFQFKDIGIENASGYSNELINYQFTDAHPTAGINYYRLRQVDLNGDSFNSPVVQVLFPAGNNFIIYPNPSITGEIYIVLPNTSNEDLFLILSNSQGQQLYSSVLSSKQDEEQLILPHKGVFYVMVGSGEFSNSFKVVW